MKPMKRSLRCMHILWTAVAMNTWIASLPTSCRLQQPSRTKTVPSLPGGCSLYCGEERDSVEPAPEQQPYFWGGASINYASWHLSSLLGIALADVIPAEWNMGFAGTLALLGLMTSLLVGKAAWLAAAVSALAAVAAYALPLKLNIVVAIAAALAIGLLIDHTSSTKAQPSEDPT